MVNPPTPSTMRCCRSATYYDSGSFYLVTDPLADPCRALFDRLGTTNAAATISGFAATPCTRSANPELATAISHLREVLGDERYESLARIGEDMTNAGVLHTHSSRSTARGQNYTPTKTT